MLSFVLKPNNAGGNEAVSFFLPLGLSSHFAPFYAALYNLFLHSIFLLTFSRVSTHPK